MKLLANKLEKIHKLLDVNFVSVKNLLPTSEDEIVKNCTNQKIQPDENKMHVVQAPK